MAVAVHKELPTTKTHVVPAALFLEKSLFLLQAAEDRTNKSEPQRQHKSNFWNTDGTYDALEQAGRQAKQENSVNSKPKLQERLAQAEQQVSTDASSRSKLQKQLENAEQQLSAAVSSKLQLQEELYLAQQQLSLDASSKLQLQEQLKQAEEQLVSKQDSMSALQEKLQQAEEQSCLNVSSRAEAQAEAQAAQQQLEDAKSELFWQQEKVDEHEAVWRGRLKVAETDLEDVHNKLDDEREHIAKVQQMLDQAQQQLEEHSKSKVDLQQKLEEAQRQLRQEQDKVRNSRCDCCIPT